MPVKASEDSTFDRDLEALLLESLRSESPQTENGPIRLADRAEDGRLLAGFSGATSYGWLHVHMVWVSPQERRKGRMRELLEKAFDIAQDRGCHAAWLDTSSPSACVAWEKLGFVEFGCLANVIGQHPERHRRWFMQRQIALPI